MTIDKQKLKELAESILRNEQGENLTEAEYSAFRQVERDFESMTQPAVILALLVEIEALQGLYRMHQQTETREMIGVKRERDQLKADNEALRSAAQAAREFIMHEAEMRRLLDENSQVSHRHPRRQAAIASIDAAMAKEASQ